MTCPYCGREIFSDEATTTVSDGSGGVLTVHVDCADSDDSDG